MTDAVKSTVGTGTLVLMVAWALVPSMATALETPFARENANVAAETSLPTRQARAVAAKRVAAAKAERLAAKVTALPPSMRGGALQAMAREHGVDVARAAAKVAGVSTALLGLGGAR